MQPDGRFRLRCRRPGERPGVWRPTGAATWRTRRNKRVVSARSLFRDNMTSSTKPEVQSTSHCRQRTTRVTDTGCMYRRFGKFGHTYLYIRYLYIQICIAPKSWKRIRGAGAWWLDSESRLEEVWNTDVWFLPRDAMLACYMLSSYVRLSPSVCQKPVLY